MMTRKGFTLIEVMIVVAIIGILIAIAVPGFIRSREVSRQRTCQGNLSQIDGAKAAWALENNKTGDDAPTFGDLVMSGRAGYLRSEPKCPLSGTYSIGTVSEFPDCDAVGKIGSDEFPHDFPGLDAEGGGEGS